ncbi:MAG TPA: YafY family protein [Pseudomonadales bacterium]
MAHPTERVLAVLELLQTHGRLSGAELARRLDVDVRTVRRYITTLESIGIPITAERGRYGAYMLVKGFKLPPLMFSNDEILAISLGLLAVRGLGLAQAAQAVESAEAKLERVMPANLKRRVRAVGETTTLDVRAAAPASDSRTLAALTAAAHERQRVRIRYVSAAGERSERDFDPYGLVFRRQRWYVAGFCHLRQGLRSFRIDRIQHLEVSDVLFDPPRDFDAARHVTFSIASLGDTANVEIVFDASAEDVLAQFDPTFGLLESRGERTVLKTRTESFDWLARRLSGLPFGFEIIEPDALRTALREHVARLRAIVDGRPRAVRSPAS